MYVSPSINASDIADVVLNLTNSHPTNHHHLHQLNDSITTDDTSSFIFNAFTTTDLPPESTSKYYISDGSIIAKITLLLVITAVVLIASYKFVVRLFLGYADRKDEMLPDDFSDDEDSAVVKRAAVPTLDIG